MEQVPVRNSIADPWNFGVDPDPGIHASDKWSIDLLKANKVFLLTNFWRYIYIIFQR